MEKFDIFQNYFSAHIKILRIFGLWSCNGFFAPNKSSELFYLFYRTIFLFTFAYLFTVAEIIQLFFTWQNFDDFINNLCYAIVHVMACLKITIIILRGKDIKRITENFQSGIFQIRKNQRVSHESKIVEECILRTKKLLNIYFLIGTSVVLNGLLVPFYVNNSDTPSTMGHVANENLTILNVFEKRRKLPYMSYFPFDTNVTPNHELAYVYQAFSLMTLSPIIVTTDVLYGSILLHIATQLRILSETLISLKSIGENNLKKLLLILNHKNYLQPTVKIVQDELLRREIYRLLKQCVSHHYAIIGITSEMERIFSILVLLQFLCNLVIMCFPLFQITSVPIMSFPFFSMVSLMTAMMYQLFIFCNCGDQVTHQSSLLAEAAYLSEWHNDDCSSIKFKKAILLIISRSRRPLKLTVAKFAVLSRETYLKVVQGSASYFMFLRRMRGDE